MCGIFFHAGEGSDGLAVREGFEKLRHRGPDSTVSVDLCDAGGFLGFHRLAINDLTREGDQPMRGEGNVYLACNGEIYNHAAVEREFALECESKSDCECILRLYEKEKKRLGSVERALERVCAAIDGEFAFLVVDLDESKILACRDAYGVRPLFVGTGEGSLGFASELKALDALFDRVEQFRPSVAGVYCLKTKKLEKSFAYNDISLPEGVLRGPGAYDGAERALRASVRARLMSDAPICALLSGGLDSSLVCALLSREIAPAKLRTFSIGMEGSTDLEWARVVAKHIGSEHHEVLVTAEEMISAIPDVIRAIESYDVTTVRASTPNWLVAKHISESTPFKVVFSGEMSDEVCKGYAYFKKAPSASAAHEESNSLLENLCYFDNLRADRCISAHGLEARVPFSDRRFVKHLQSVDPELQTCVDRIEKHVLRKAFEDSGLLPSEALWRKKEAFSDAVSSAENSWHRILRARADSAISDAELAEGAAAIEHCRPRTKEAYWYRKIFNGFYKNDRAIPKFWMPNAAWVGESLDDPSARELC